MASADLFIRAGDTSPVFTDTILDPVTGSPISNLASVTFTLRSLQGPQPVTLTGTASIVSGAVVQYAWSSTDTATAGAGLYNAEWHYTLTGGQTGTFPNNGYRTISIEYALTNAPQQLVSIADAKEYASIPSSDTTQDEKLLRFITALRPVVESITGPVIPQQYEEWYPGGSVKITLRHRPRPGFGTSPLLTLMSCSEYLGPIEWPLAIIQSPDVGQLYSCMLNARLGQVVRRTAGGGVQPFAGGPGDPQAVHVIYEAGQNFVPANVYEGTLELIRHNFQQTQQATGRVGGVVPAGGRGEDPDVSAEGIATGLIWGKALSMLSPTKRFPSFA